MESQPRFHQEEAVTKTTEDLADSTREQWQGEARQPVDAAYVERRNALWSDPVLRPVLKPLDDARGAMLKSAAALATINAEHKAGRLADDQVPRLRANVLDEARQASENAERASTEAMRTLDRALRARVFATPERGPATAEAKADLRMRLDHREDVAAAVHEATEAAVAAGDGLALRLLSSSWGRDYIGSRGGEADDVMTGVQARATEAADLFHEDVRPAMATLAKLDALDEARMAGLAAVYTDHEGVETGRL
jgi:hypothetical protein